MAWLQVAACRDGVSSPDQNAGNLGDNLVHCPLNQTSAEHADTCIVCEHYL